MSLTLIIILLAVAVVLAFFVILYLHFRKKKMIKEAEEKINEKVEQSAGKLSTCFGGNDNIVSITQKGSRVTVLLKDISLADKEEINKELSSVMFMNNKVVFVIGSMSEEFSRLLEENIKKVNSQK